MSIDIRKGKQLWLLVIVNELKFAKTIVAYALNVVRLPNFAGKKSLLVNQSLR